MVLCLRQINSVLPVLTDDVYFWILNNSLRKSHFHWNDNNSNCKWYSHFSFEYYLTSKHFEINEINLVNRLEQSVNLSFYFSLPWNFHFEYTHVGDIIDSIFQLDLPFLNSISDVKQTFITMGTGDVGEMQLNQPKDALH